MREWVRDLFGFVNINKNGRLSHEECNMVVSHRDHSTEFVSTAARGLLSLFPTLRKDASELEKFAIEAIGKLVVFLGNNENSIGSTIVDVRNMLDEDGDRYVQRAEVGKYYNMVGKRFLQATKTIKEMGPLMAIFRDMNGGGGGGGGGFKMDL